MFAASKCHFHAIRFYKAIAWFMHIWLSSRRHLSRIFPFTICSLVKWFTFSDSAVSFRRSFICIAISNRYTTVLRCTESSYLFNCKYMMLILDVCAMRLFWFIFFFCSYFSNWNLQFPSHILVLTTKMRWKFVWKKDENQLCCL